MSKLTFEDKINIYNDRNEGLSISYLAKKYDARDNVNIYLIKLKTVNKINRRSI